MKHLWKVLIATAVMLALVLVPTTATAIEYDGTLILDNKNPDTWERIGDGYIGTLQFNFSGSEFEYNFSATVPENIEYCLIYYADRPDRFVDWGGDNPGKLIASGIATGGVLNLSGSVDLGMDLPSWPDANMYEYNYCDPPDNYNTCNGAKIWLVPFDCYVEPEVTLWQPTRFLFETDLIWYNDIDVESNIVIAFTEVLEDLISVDINPNVLNFGAVYPGDCSQYQNLYIENTGSVDLLFTATTDSEFYQESLLLDGSGIPYVNIDDWGMVVEEGVTKNAKPKVCVEAGYEAGAMEGMIVFWAEEAP